jgi:plasmid replication initiation protein
MADKKATSTTNHKVSQSNKLIQASQALTLNEKRLILLAASQLDPRKPAPADCYITVRADNFAEVFGMEPRHTYEVLDDASKRLMRRMMYRYKNGKVVEELRWVFHAKYKEGQGCVELGFSPTVLPHLTRLHKEFTTFQLRQVGRLNSFYAIRMYELMAQYVTTGTWWVALEQLRDSLDLGDKYKSVKDLRRWVLDPGLEEVNKLTDITASMEPRRKGRMIVGFTFTITKKASVEQQLELPV